MQVTVRDLMTSQPPTISELTTIKEATQMILDQALSELYVVDDDQRLLGTVSDYSLLKARLIRSDSQEPASRFMSRSMLLLTPDMRLEEVSGFFRESCHSQLAVVESGRVIGQLFRRCVLRTVLVIDELSSDSKDSDRITRVESVAEAVPPHPVGLRPSPSGENAAARDQVALR